jgi:hypothetical protein
MQRRLYRGAMHQDRHCKVGIQSLRSTFLHQISVSKGQLVIATSQKRDSFSMQTFPSVLSLPITVLSRPFFTATLIYNYSSCVQLFFKKKFVVRHAYAFYFLLMINCLFQVSTHDPVWLCHVLVAVSIQCADHFCLVCAPSGWNPRVNNLILLLKCGRIFK